MYKLGVIGAGNMAAAIVKGAAKTGFLAGGQVCIYDPAQGKSAALAAACGGTAAQSLNALAKSTDILLFAAKPEHVKGVVLEVGNLLKEKALISIALGWGNARYLEILPGGARVAFVMPNICCLAGEGMAIMEEGHTLSQEEAAFTIGLFESIGKTTTLNSTYMNAAGTLAGCGPAFLSLAVEALADGAVLNGLPRETADHLAAQMAAGTAKMLAGGTHPGVLKDSVCSPGGSTIRGVQALEDGGVRAAFISAVDAAVNIK